MSDRCGVREKDRDRGFLMMENDDGQMFSKIFVLMFSFDVFAADQQDRRGC